MKLMQQEKRRAPPTVNANVRDFLRREIERLDKRGVRFDSKDARHRYLARRIALKFGQSVNEDTVRTAIRSYRLDDPPMVCELRENWREEMRRELGPEVALRARTLEEERALEDALYPCLSKLDNRMPSREVAFVDEGDS